MILLLPASESIQRHNPNTMLFGASLSAKLGAQVQVEIAADYADLTSRILAAEVHLAWAPPLVCARAEGSVRAILPSVRQGRSSYQAALIVRAGEVRSKEALAGLRAAWVDPLSSAGHLLVTDFLASIDMPPDELFADQRFTGSYRDALTAVAEREADVASIYVARPSREHAREQMIELVGRAADLLDVLMFTRATPNDGLIITSAVEEQEAARIAGVLVSDPPSSLLKALEVEGFVQAMPADYRMLL